RAFQLQVSDNDNKKLGELAGLAVQSGFDWVHYTRSNYIHASVIRDVCQTSLDLAFILDTSGSVGRDNFDKIKTFVKHVIDFFNIGPKGTHVAVVTYSTFAVVEFQLNTHTTKTALKKAVNQIYYRAGWTYTADAIELTTEKVFATKFGMRPDKGIPKVTVLLTDGFSSGWGVSSAANAIKKLGVNMFCIGVGGRTNKPELRDIASDPDSTHVFSLVNFNDLSVWVDKLSAVSCDEGAAVSACDDTISKVDGGSFLYFRTEFVSITGGISVEVRDTKGISHLYTSLTTKNPGPMDPNSLKNENDASPRSLRLQFKSHRNSKQLVYVAVQGQMKVNEFKLSMWDTLFSSDSYTANPTEENKSPINVIRVYSTVSQYRLRYSITDSSNSQKMFQIDSNSGQITTTGRLDRETTARYDLTVLAQDIDNACHKGRTVVIVNVKDINDNPPVFKQNKYYANVNENRPSGTSVAMVTATDKDSSSVLTYRLTNTFSKFSIDNKGNVRTTAVLDYEQQTQYTLDIRASDGKYEAKTSLDIGVVDVNERPVFLAPCVTSNQCTFDVSEDESINKIITTLEASDPDGGSIKYSLRQLDSQDKVFSIDSSGRIALLKKLDRETKSIYNLLVSASDNGRPVLAAEARAKIVVTDVNDNAPKFALDKYTGSVYENTRIGRQVIQVVAVDADSGSNSKLTYNLQSGDTAYFTIEQSTGIIRTKRSLDREVRASYQLTVRAVDGGGLDGQTSVKINVLDVNDNVPQFTKNEYLVSSVNEDVALGSVIETVSATDKDTGINADLRYSILSGNHGNTFSLDSKSGQVKLQASLDYERRQSYRLTISVSDRGSPALSSTSALVVMVTDVNDNSPIFGSRAYKATVKENSVKGTSVVKVSATDRDSGLNGKVQYFVVNGNSGNTFTVDQDSGLITINNSPSFKTKGEYDLKLEARDKGQPIRNATVHAIITIEDVNDNAPVFDSNTYQAHVNEDAAKGTAVITVTANDADTGPRGRVLYSIVSGNTGNKFTIDDSTGAIRVSSPLDRETTPSFALIIEARDGGVPSLSSKCLVNVNITDVNDNAPVFNGPYTFHIAEDKPVGTLVGQVTAGDRDSGSNGKVTYSGSTASFTVEPTTGKIFLSKTLDYETQTSYSFTITAMDHGSPAKQTTTVVKVMVDDVNDNAPKFPQDMYNCSVAENMASRAGVCYVTAVDPDSGANGKLLYSLTGGDHKFAINPATGEITTTAPLDRETTGSYHLVVTAQDGQGRFRSVSRLSDSVDVYVDIQDENDNQPAFVGAPFHFGVLESASVGTSVGKVSASDADTGNNGKLTYTIFDGNTHSGFSINANTGVISTKNPLDREKTASYALTVVAMDSGKPFSQSARTVVTVAVDDVNDNPPIFTQKMFSGKIREDASIGSSVLQVKAHDSDTGSNGQITFSLSGPGSENFTIDATGFVMSATSLDYEQTSAYLMTVTAKDSGVPSLSATAHVNITIINVNDNVPTFVSQAQVTYVSEDVAIGTRVVKLNATDSDGSSLLFAITEGDTDGAFAIGGASGVISVAKRLDRETIANYTLVVEAKDTGGKSVSNNATIRVIDVNDNKPVFDSNSYSARITENQPQGTSLVEVHATDRDEGTNAEITYLLTSGDQNKFQVDSSTGLISTRAVLDREQQASYVLSVTAKDHGSPSQSSVVKVTVTVDDVNDNLPKFSQNNYAVSLVENTARNSVVLRLQARDPDDGSNGRVSYAIVSGDTKSAFSINPSTGQLSVTGPIDRETTASYNLIVRASDSGKPPRSSSTSVKITVTDENDNAPKYTNQNTTFVVMENAARGTQVGVVMATDADVGENARIGYKIVVGSGGVFVINPTNGAITVYGSIDRESKATYPLTIRASDHGSPVMFTDKMFNIVVKDVNDNPPVFDKNPYRASINESSPVNSVVVKVKTTDADVGPNAVVQYQIVSGNIQDAFTIDPSTGEISTKTTLDYETIANYILTVSAMDTKYTSQTRVVIDVININDNSPIFTKRAYSGSVQENSVVLTQILSVSANDKDPFGSLIYFLNTSYTDSDRFNIDPSSGAISTADSLDRESRDHYVIQVLVIDRGIPARMDDAMVTIDVTDVNDNPPTFTGSAFAVSVFENVTIGSSVFQVNAKDRDLGKNAQISYSLVQRSAAFSIEPQTGIIRTTVKLDRESTSSYTLQCIAADHGNPRLKSKQVTIRVTVLDVNDNSPVFEKDPYQSNVKEDEAIGSLVSEVLAVDPDLDKAGKVVYSITGGNGDGMFTIANITGVISLRQVPDREAKDSYQLTVKASDLGTPPRSSTTNVNINIVDVNDNVPQINTTSLRGSVKENEPAGTYVMRLLATDADAGLNGQLTFELLTREYKDVFSLNDTNGVITTKKKLDRELQATYTLKVRVSDMGTPRLTSLADVIIDVIDVDDNCPFFQPSVYNVTIRENEKRGTHIVFVSATDPDKVANRVLDYKIKSGMPGGEFRINKDTGEITVDNNVDRESTAVFKLTVRAGKAKCDESDKNDTGIEGGGTDVLSSASAVVNIYVEDVNDNAPRFTNPSYEYDFKDIKTTELFTITATDDDLGLGGVVKYRLAGQTEHYLTCFTLRSMACEAMVFDVTQHGKISTKTLCRFDETPASSTVNSGLSHKLKCSAKGNTNNPNYRWMLNGRSITSWSPNGTYSIKRLSQEDEGSYSCLASSDAGVIQSSPATLTVYDVPVVIVHPENSSVSLEGTTTLECLAKGDPEPSYQWYKNDEFLPPSDGIDPTNQPKLILDKAIPQDEAWYTCLVTNAAKNGQVWSKSAFLKVYAQQALVDLEISVSKPHPDKRCHIFDIKSFKAMVEAEAIFTNVSAEGMCKPDPCNNCNNGGVCEQQGTGTYTCVCPPGWTGKQCSIDVNECLRAPCLNGKCKNKIGTYECACPTNFTGKNCHLRKDACAGGPCNASELCVLSEMDNSGYKCIHESNQIVMIHKEIIDESKSFDLEREIEGMIKSAPNTNDVNSKRRKRNTRGPDYGSCIVRITSFKDRVVQFVLLCPEELNVDPKESIEFVCGLLFRGRKSKSCGTGAALTTPIPPTTYPPLSPMRVKIRLFARDRSNKDIEGNDVIARLQSEGFQQQMGKQGIEFVTAKRGGKKANVGLIVGLVALAIIVIAAVGIVAGYVYHQRRKGKQSLIPVGDRAVLSRGDSRKQMLQRNVSNKDIARSEKKFINQAYTDSMYDDGEGDFMVEVNIPMKNTTPKSLTAVRKQYTVEPPVATTLLHEAPYYYDKIAPIEAEMLLDNKVPVGTFLVRKGIQSEEYVLTVKGPNGGPDHRHLLIKHTSKDQFEVQFGSMPLSLEFDSISDVIEHFQVTPIEFGGDVPDVVLTNGWDKTLV
ncbi:hypothetical protein QZH41_016191, partial [Actinostola sp. cb2023]